VEEESAACVSHPSGLAAGAANLVKPGTGTFCLPFSFLAFLVSPRRLCLQASQ
jgi:hypothetical protein